MKKDNKAIYFIKDHAIWLVFILLMILFEIANSRFLTANNIITMIRQVSMYGIASIGMTFVILLADIDLATGSILTFVNIICAYMMVNMGIHPVLAVIISLVAATLIGLLNGIMVANFRIPALIATYAAQTVFAGLALIICGGVSISIKSIEGFTVIGQGYVGAIPVPIIIMAVCFAVGSFILNKTYFGRYFYAVGGNAEAAELSGIRVRNVKYLCFALSGFFAGLAGIVMLSRTNSGTGTAGDGFEFDVITCVVLGGVSVSGGVGKLSNVLAGVLIIGALKNGMVLMNINSYIQMVVTGIVLAVAVGYDCMSKKKD